MWNKMIYAKQALKLISKPQNLPVDEPVLVVGGAKLVRKQGKMYRSSYVVYGYSRSDKAAVDNRI